MNIQFKSSFQKVTFEPWYQVAIVNVNVNNCGTDTITDGPPITYLLWPHPSTLVYLQFYNRYFLVPHLAVPVLMS